jgi:uncharacterized membrane protein
MKTSDWIFLITAISILLIAMCGCGSNSKIDIPIPGDGKTTLTGKAADQYAQVLVQNAQTASGRINETFGKMSDLAPWLFGGLLIGGVVAFITKSKWVAMIPITAGIGLALIFFLGATIGWILPTVKFGFPVVVVGVIAWRAIVYQKERNNNATALKVVSDEASKAIKALKNNIQSP